VKTAELNVRVDPKLKEAARKVAAYEQGAAVGALVLTDKEQ
jgi:hypothetical protein